MSSATASLGGGTLGGGVLGDPTAPSVSSKSSQDFLNLCQSFGSPVVFHRDESAQACPCLTPEGFRDPIWHIQHLDEPVCNEAGMLSIPSSLIEIQFKGFCQPVQASAVRRMMTEAMLQAFGEIMADDHIGIFPVLWSGILMSFYEWGRTTEDWIQYNGRKYQVISANLIPDPVSGYPWGHWEVGLRLISGIPPAPVQDFAELLSDNATFQDVADSYSDFSAVLFDHES